MESLVEVGVEREEGIKLNRSLLKKPSNAKPANTRIRMKPMISRNNLPMIHQN